MYSRNPILRSDSYKVTHWLQYPPGTTVVSSYMAARYSQVPGIDWVVAFSALNYYLDTYLCVPFTQADIDEAADVAAAHFGTADLFNRAGFQHILNKHGGHWPVRVRHAPEGTLVKLGRPIVFIENTDPEVPWVTNYVESVILKGWYGAAVATISRACKQIILESLHKTGDPGLIGFKLHDFGYRGVSSDESAETGGLAHLINFLGTDTLLALAMGRKLYDEPMPGYSIPASEHSTMTSWGRAREVDAYRNMLQKYPKGLVACVSDSWDIYNACDYIWGQVLKSEVMAREGTLVIRPDSGDPHTVVPRILDILGARFGFTVNGKGYKVLDPHVRVIQGDGVDITSIPTILDAINTAGWSTDNLAFGMGGGLLQKVNRDTFGFALKCCEVQNADGTSTDVFKKPITDSAKVSLKLSDMWDEVCDLPIVYDTGRDFNRSTLSQVRSRAAI